MKNLQGFNEIEARLHMLLDALSNNESVHIPDEFYDIAADEFKAALKRQFSVSEREFKLRASNIGRPLCQLQMESKGQPKARMDYNHVVRMLIGDTTETIVNLLIGISGLEVTGSKVQVEFPVNGAIIKGEDDLEIAGKVWDVKSCSPYAFQHKWPGGWDSIFNTDTFGYAEQLYVYAEGKAERMGGWIVVEKSTGEVKVVPATPTPEQMVLLKNRVERTQAIIAADAPFAREFQDEEETYYKKPTGNRTIPMVCTFCQFVKPCWPEAKQLPKALSKAENPPLVWYTHVKEE